jgi:hypothetical protein
MKQVKNMMCGICNKIHPVNGNCKDYIRDRHMKLNFGLHKGKRVEDLTSDSYLQWLAKPVYSGKYYKSLHSSELNWKVPLMVSIAARMELEKRGWDLIGTRWEKR